MPLHIDPRGWVTLAIAAFIIGVSKTGIPGVGIFAISLATTVLDPTQSTGTILPLLSVADFVAVAFYRRHAVWSHVWRLMPWAVIGIFLGWFAMGHVDTKGVGRIMAGILLSMVALHYWRKRRMEVLGDKEDETIPHSLWFIATLGILAGFTTMIANAAGPIMIIYLLAMRLPKLEFIGTGAWYFCLLNLIKVPFMIKLGWITPQSAVLDCKLAGFVVVGALFGKPIFQRINQRLFESIALGLSVLFAIRLLIMNTPTLEHFVSRYIHL